MVTKTIEYEQVQTVKETLDVCDDCGREVDPDGLTFKPHIEKEYDIRGKRMPKPKASPIHFCSECLKRSDEDYKSSTEVEAEWWLNKRVGNRPRKKVIGDAVTAIRVIIALSIIVAPVAGLTTILSLEVGLALSFVAMFIIAVMTLVITDHL